MSCIDFVITTIDTDVKNKAIYINSSYDYDPSCINDDSITLLDKASRNLVDYKIEVDGKQIKLILSQWPVPNKEYILSIQKLKSVTGEALRAGVRRKIFFNSDIVSKINIIKPADNEHLKDIIFEWEEIQTNETKEKVNSYYIEIAEDQAFYKITKTSLVENRTKVQMSSLISGQYYIRCRAQKDGQYGEWSETKTFIADTFNADPDVTIEDDENYLPEIEDELTILTYPDNNETPESILIEFDDEIDVDSIKDLIVMRRKV